MLKSKYRLIVYAAILAEAVPLLLLAAKLPRKAKQAANSSPTAQDTKIGNPRWMRKPKKRRKP